MAVAGQYRNEGFAAATVSGQNLRDCDLAYYYGTSAGRPGIDIQIYTNGEDADVSTGPRIPVGSTVTWTYVITNTGAQALTSISLKDNREGQITCPARSLQPGQTMTCREAGTARPGQYANRARVKAWAADGTRVTDTDWSHYYGYSPVPNPGVDLEAYVQRRGRGHADRSADPNGFPGHLDLRHHQHRRPDAMGHLPLRRGTGAHRLPGVVAPPRRQHLTCVKTGTAEAGQYAAEAWVDAWPDDGARVTDTDWFHYYGCRDYH